MDITQLETPALLLDYGMMQQNMRVMAELIQGTGMRLYPHYKSHKCPQIALLQIEQQQSACAPLRLQDLGGKQAGQHRNPRVVCRTLQAFSHQL